MASLGHNELIIGCVLIDALVPPHHTSSHKTSHCVMYDEIDLLHKPHNAPVPYPLMHHFEKELFTFLFQSGVLWDIGWVHCGICQMVYW